MQPSSRSLSFLSIKTRVVSLPCWDSGSDFEVLESASVFVFCPIALCSLVFVFSNLANIRTEICPLHACEGHTEEDAHPMPIIMHNLLSF